MGGGGREGMDELFALSVNTGSKRPGQPASDMVDTEVREREGGERERGGEGEKEWAGEGERGWTSCSPSLWTWAARDPDSRPPIWRTQR